MPVSYSQRCGTDENDLRQQWLNFWYVADRRKVREVGTFHVMSHALAGLHRPRSAAIQYHDIAPAVCEHKRDGSLIYVDEEGCLLLDPSLVD